MADEVYALARFLGQRFGSTGIVAIGSGQADEPVPGAVHGAVVVCADVIQQLADPMPLLRTLRRWLDHAAVAVLSTPELDLAGPELKALLDSAGLSVAFLGLTGRDQDRVKQTAVAVLSRAQTPVIRPAPADFRVVALMAAYNEADIIVPSLRRLIAQGVDVYVIDNWSTDGTYECARELLGRGVIGLERFPPTGPPLYCQWEELLRRKEELAAEIPADWFIHHDVDEIKESPWPDLRLKDAIYLVDQSGFNCLEHTIIHFRPVDDGFVAGSDFGEYFRFFDWQYYGPQARAWKQTGHPVALAPSGGHDVQFLGRRIYPYNFLTKHYPVRSQAHGQRKVLSERQARYSPAERLKGWHCHYDHVGPGTNFLCQPRALYPWDSRRFYEEFLVQRLTSGLLLT